MLSPLVGFLLALLLVLIVSWTCRRATPFGVDRSFRLLQFVSASLYSLGHGGNDAQKTMGIIAVLLYSQGHLGSSFHVPLWVVLACQSAMALGTLFGGWRIVHTMGSKITRLNPMQGFCAETGGAITLFLATWLGVPVSTTHTITGAIVGVGAARRTSAVRWGIAGNIRRRLGPDPARRRPHRRMLLRPDGLARLSDLARLAWSHDAANLRARPFCSWSREIRHASHYRCCADVGGASCDAREYWNKFRGNVGVSLA